MAGSLPCGKRHGLLGGGDFSSGFRIARWFRTLGLGAPGVTPGLWRIGLLPAKSRPVGWIDTTGGDSIGIVVGTGDRLPARFYSNRSPFGGVYFVEPSEVFFKYPI